MTIVSMSKAAAIEIISWTYEPPYSMYNLENVPEQIEELLNGNYYAYPCPDGTVYGFFCYGHDAQVPGGQKNGVYKSDALDIGVGMNPTFTGQGYGQSFFQAGLSYGRETFKPNRFRLSVNRSNQRAINLYRKCNFATVDRFNNPGPPKAEFLLMEEM
ncbi:GNAT family N-acetyltransferase [Geomicrobium sp. JCM 19039]|uniref:GNAT family N-acetyltransferase n=1 Tax=Geomicrobium sp. JCM 19039 TaxID=1460636 RepID=UPI00045F1112|nr:GNAT family protein [Geomicrobium sp. JCM 19039]GAK14549.1 ribosomal-protein-alanine acetyltransferase [Geomicrobium sp. JCM 19039]